LNQATPTTEEAVLVEEATRWAKANRKVFAANFTSTDKFPGERVPVALFMAGSPGAGKTEASRALVRELGGGLRIDPDEFRQSIPGYTGANSWVVHRAVSYLVEAVLDRAFRQSQSFLLDGTLSSYDVADKNVSRCLNKNRDVQIIYVYQEPLLAWHFVQAREVHEGRNIPADQFVHQFFASRECVEKLKVRYNKAIKIDVLLKNTDGTPGKYYANVRDLVSVVPLKYTEEQVKRLVTSP
jgi:UDP-N-acetylglucosamine kinase